MTTFPTLEELRSNVASNPAIIALSEGGDPRVIAGAVAAQQAGIARIILVGPKAEIEAGLSAIGAQVSADLMIQDPATSDLHDEMAETFFQLRQHKGVDREKAAAVVRDPLVFASLLVRLDHAAGTVGGAVATTSDVVRAALQVIGKAKDSPIVSSFFLMAPPAGAAEPARPMIYADCGLVIDPSSDDQAAIAAASCTSLRALSLGEPKVAFLSFSTKGSARHPAVDKVATAAQTFAAQNPDIASDGELQFDAAFMPAVGSKKAPGSATAGQANVMIFPSLDAGNIAYKITQRIGGYAAIGPILQGLAKPANDLSRGCSADDVTMMIAVTVRQANNKN
ncbi:phosphate acetyltransferase [Aestuariibius sp. HNIBRBA575]|uniref:phosphate acetyltransferase n=1 Tax=Aestuariibius sp. HNIBRBA575 TaxID=3233343 RepID=UPI0034A59D8D